MNAREAAGKPKTKNQKMKNLSLKVIQVAVVGAFALASLPSAQAVATLSISQTGGVGAAITVTDGLAPDGSLGLFGSVVWVGSIGNWSLVVTSGTTKPLNGTATAAELHLNVNATSNAPIVDGIQTLTIGFSEISFGPIAAQTFRVDSSTTIDPGAGNTGENVSTSAKWDSANTLFGGALLASSSFITPPGAQSTNLTSGTVTDPNVYSLTGLVTITHNPGTGGVGAGRTTSAQIDIIQNAPDGGFTLALLGGAMVGLVGLRRKLRTA